MNAKSYFITLFAGLLLCACDSDSDSTVKNERKDIVLSDTEIQIINQQNKRAYDMLKYLNKHSENANFVVSPLSTQFALGMLANGAKENTLTELTNALCVSSPNEINALSHKLLKELPSADNCVNFACANSLWINDGKEAFTDYSNLLSDYYNAETINIDLSTDKAIKEINRWCSSKTNGMIDNIAVQPYPEETWGVLINSLYFKGVWKTPFPTKNTTRKEFLNANGSVSQVDMMGNELMLPYLKADCYSFAKLHYGNEAFVMTILLPDEGESLTSAIESYSSQSPTTSPKMCKLSLPRFKINTKIILNDYLQHIGIKDAFDAERSNFSGMSPNEARIDHIQHSATIEVNEKGTEAAAITNTGMSTSPGPSEKVTFNVNRPFIFIIEENSTGTVLFIGRITEL